MVLLPITVLNYFQFYLLLLKQHLLEQNRCAKALAGHRAAILFNRIFLSSFFFPLFLI
jgi:hypothetical protein